MPTKCSYPDCLSIFPDTLLETCRKENCNYHLHHVCQTEYESKQNADIGLHKYCINCCNEVIREKYPSIDLNTTTVQATSVVQQQKWKYK